MGKIRQTGGVLADNWRDRLSGSWDRMASSIQTMTGLSPSEMAAKDANAVQLWAQRVANNIGKWETNCKAAKLDKWKAKFPTGATSTYKTRFQDAVKGTRDDMAMFLENLKTFINTNLDTLQSSNPKSADPTSQENRAVAWIKLMRNYHKPAGL